MAQLLVDLPFGLFPVALGVIYNFPRRRSRSRSASSMRGHAGKSTDLNALLRQGQSWEIAAKTFTPASGGLRSAARTGRAMLKLRWTPRSTLMAQVARATRRRSRRWSTAPRRGVAGRDARAGSRTDAEDALQAALTKLWTEAHASTRPGSVEGWFRRILVNLCLDRRRSFASCSRSRPPPRSPRPARPVRGAPRQRPSPPHRCRDGTVEPAAARCHPAIPRRRSDHGRGCGNAGHHAQGGRGIAGAGAY